MSTTNPDRSPLAYKDEEFLDSEEARPLRILAEYMQPMRALANEGVVGTIVTRTAAERCRSKGTAARMGARAWTGCLPPS